MNANWVNSPISTTYSKAALGLTWSKTPSRFLPSSRPHPTTLCFNRGINPEHSRIVDPLLTTSTQVKSVRAVSDTTTPSDTLRREHHECYQCQ